MKLFIFSLLFFFYSLGFSLETKDISAKSCVLINAKSGAVLFEKNPHLKLAPASITKIATCIYALEFYGDRLDDMVEAERDSIGSISPAAKRRANYTTPSWWLETDAGHIGIKAGEKLSLNDLLLGMMVPSADDAANVIAQYLSGSIAQFMDDLNSYLKDLGLLQTHFMNPHGLHHPKHYTTAFDMALLTQTALQNPTFRKIILSRHFTRPKTNKQEEAVFAQTNRLVRPGKFYYPKAIGVKTGYHSDAENTLVAAAESRGRVLIAVLMGVKKRAKLFEEAKLLFEEAFSEPLLRKTLVQKGQQPFRLKISGANHEIVPYTTQDVHIDYFATEEPKLTCQVKWDEVSLPVSQGQKLGNLRILNDREDIVRSMPLYAANEADITVWQKFWSFSFLPKVSSSLWLKRTFLLGIFLVVVAVFFHAVSNIVD